MIIKTFTILTYLTHGYQGTYQYHVERFDNLSECQAVIQHLQYESEPIGAFGGEKPIKDRIIFNMECKELEYPTNE